MSESIALALRRRAMDLLARREHSHLELSRKLGQRFPEAAAEQVRETIHRLADENLQSDQRFAENYLRRRHHEGFGWLHIRANLQARGVSEEIISGIALPEEDWIAAAGKALSRRLDRGPAERLIPGSKAHQRLFRFLQNRGFATETIHRALAKHFSAAIQ